MQKKIYALIVLSVFCLALSPTGAQAQTYSIDGMIGQVNGRAIYTNDVFDEQLSETLAQWGRELSLSEFRKRAAERIVVRLNGMVTDALIYGEAQRDLSDQERQGLAVAMTKQREQLLREYGQGSAAVAEAVLQRQKGMGLDEMLENWRQAMVVQRYMRQKLRPMVNVTRRDIKRYYQDHYDEFNRPASRSVRVIQVESEEDVQYISDLLAGGTPFTEAAADQRNKFRPDQGGLMGDMAGKQLFADEQVNQATLDLKAGEYVGPLTVGNRQWFVAVDKINEAEGRSLMQVQTEIHNLLFEQQLREQTQRYREELFEKGSYNSIEQMAQTLVEIAEDRYARTETQ